MTPNPRLVACCNHGHICARKITCKGSGCKGCRPAGGFELLLRLSRESNNGIATDGCIGHVPPNVVQNAQVARSCVATPAIQSSIYYALQPFRGNLFHHHSALEGQEPVGTHANWQTALVLMLCKNRLGYEECWTAEHNRSTPHLPQNVVVAGLEGDVEELAHLGQLRTRPHQTICEVPASAPHALSG